MSYFDGMKSIVGLWLYQLMRSITNWQTKFTRPNVPHKILVLGSLELKIMLILLEQSVGMVSRLLVVICKLVMLNAGKWGELTGIQFIW